MIWNIVNPHKRLSETVNDIDFLGGVGGEQRRVRQNAQSENWLSILKCQCSKGSLRQHV